MMIFLKCIMKHVLRWVQERSEKTLNGFTQSWVANGREKRMFHFGEH